MKRILTTVVTLAAVLSIGTAANAAPYTYDVSGPNGSVVTVSSFASSPCTDLPAGMPASLCFTNPLSAGSSLTVDITGYDATLTSGSIFINTNTVLFGLVTITTDVDVSLSGATGTLAGNDILWSTDATYTVAPTSTLTCSDFGPSQPVSCGTLGLTAGTVYPISILNLLGNTSTLTSVDLGTWDLSGDLASLLGSTRVTTSISNVAPNYPAGWLYFGADLGFPVPEPGSMALVLLGLGGLALRARKA
jgi:hypothetical protein